MTSARVPALMFASCASATTLAASACSFFGDRLGVVDADQHGVAAEFVARHSVDARPGKSRARLRDESWHYHGVDVGGRQKEAVDHVGAGQSKLHRSPRAPDGRW
jgi:hypothetical protein